MTKKKIMLMALTLALCISLALITCLPAVYAHEPPWEIPTWCYVSVQNPIIGVGQQVVIIYWLNAVPPTAVGAYGDRWTFTVEVTKPDGSKTTLGPFTSDPVGGGWCLYTPDQTGTYTLVAKFAEHTITGIPVPPGGYWMGTEVFIGDTYLASTSDPVTLIVQEDPIEPWPEAPLPTEYWTRPISSANREWWRLAGNWLAGVGMGADSFQTNGPTNRFGYGTGPESAHIMWATPMWAGGIMDERFGVTGYQTAHYEGLSFIPPIILDGKIYYNVESLPRYGWRCLDLYTGEELYFHNTTGPVTGVGGGFDYSGRIAGELLSFGQIYNYDSPNQHGGLPYLWSAPTPDPFAPPGPAAPWMMFDAYTGNYICSIENVPSWAGAYVFGVPAATSVYGKDGSLTFYNIVGTPNPMGPFFPDVPPFYLQCWNTSRAIWYEPFWFSNEYWMWRPTLNKTFDGRNGYSLNVSIPNVQGSILAIREGEFVIGGTSGKHNATYVEEGNLWALSLEPGQEGTLLWNITFTPPETVPDVAVGTFGMGGMAGPTVDPEDGVFLFSESITRRWWGYSLETGQPLWGPTAPEPALNFYGMYSNIYQGKLLSCGYGGVLTAYDITTGDVLWNYTASQVGYESPYGNYPIGIVFIADGKIYLTSSEHSPTQPLWRGSYLRCIDAETGAELWKILHWGAGMGPGEGAVIADGYIVGLNLYDNQIYCYGKGPSATTVSASPSVIANGTSVLITGTVTDQSPGAKGTPAIADEYMQAWMEYLYMQQAIPGDATGVEVTLDAVDPNGNVIHIGRVTSDMSGMFKKMWTPEVLGEYTIIATFEGSKSYWASYAETAIGVSEAPAPQAPLEEEAEAPAYSTIDLVIIATVVVVAILVLYTLYTVRKQRK